jgi:hypothetical protein
MFFWQANSLIVPKMIGCHLCGELKENSDEDIKITVDVVVIRKHDALAVIPTETELEAVNEYAQNIHLERSCGKNEPGIFDSLRVPQLFGEILDWDLRFDLQIYLHRGPTFPSTAGVQSYSDIGTSARTVYHQESIFSIRDALAHGNWQLSKLVYIPSFLLPHPQSCEICFAARSHSMSDAKLD